MGITQNSKVQVRVGLQQNIPALDTGEIGYAIDTQRLYIGNGTVLEGAPYAGNTEIVTAPNSNLPAPVLVPAQGSFNESPNGSRVTFTMNVAPYPNSLIVWKNSPVIPNGINYTYPGLSGPLSITFTVAPLNTDNLYYYCFV